MLAVLAAAVECTAVLADFAAVVCATVVCAAVLAATAVVDVPVVGLGIFRIKSLWIRSGLVISFRAMSSFRSTPK